jgi:cytosine/adenosine deaminase-related metal-dependent hydrolase
LILEIGPQEELLVRCPDAQIERLPNCLVMPGLVNAHQHGRGISQIQLGYHDNFLELWIASRRGRGVLDPYPITMLAAANMLAHGVTTTIHANYSYGSGDYEAEVRASLQAYDESGIRTTMCIGAMDRGYTVYPPHEACFLAGLPDELRIWLTRPDRHPYAGDADATIALMERLLAEYADHPRIRLC